jgi:tetratricopeptide (TPR) repeat protein/tRNA A-37 threonylcarbamoyl transferase component Bud32
VNPGRWSRVSALLESALAVAPDERLALYARECTDDPTIGTEVERLVAADSRARRFLDAVPAPATATAPPLATGARVAGYTIVRRLGVGGMGVVFEAQQERPSRRVALKLVQSTFASQATLLRFRYEAEALGRLRHAGIAQVYEAGVDVGPEGVDRPFLAMEYVEDARSITEHVRARGFDTDAIVRLFVAVCDAVQHGHERGVLHRDIKASNVLVDASGAPKLIDFGVAKVIGEVQTRATEAGEIVGTLASMSPEQLDGDLDVVDVRSDVYGLGALLYELLCGRPMIDLRGISLADALVRAREALPPRPTRVRPDISIELEWIVLRAIEPERERRYPSAAELAQDLERYLADRPVLASPPSTVYRVRKFVLRNRLAVGAALAIVVAILVGAVTAFVERDRALLAKARAEKAEGLAEERLARLTVESLTNSELARFQGGILKSVDPDVDGRDVRVVDVLARASAGLDERVDLDPRLELALRRSIAEAYEALGLPAEVDAQLLRMRPLWEAVHGPDDPETLEYERLRMKCDAFVAAADEREPRARDGWRRACAIHGAESVQAAQWGAGLSLALVDLGRHAEAEALVRNSISTLRDELGPTSREALGASVVLGRLLNDTRRYEEAEAFKRGVYEACRADLGEDNAETLRAKKQLAVALQAVDRVEEAIAMLREVVAQHARRSSARSADALTARSDLAEFLRRARRPLEALAELDSALVDGRATYGERHAFVHRIRMRRAVTLGALSRRGEAITDLVEAIPLAEADLGPDDPRTLEMLDALVRQLFESGRSTDALEHAGVAWRRSVRAVGADAAITLGRGSAYGAMLHESGRTADAIAVVTEVGAAQDRVLGPLHKNSLLTLTNLTTLSGHVGDRQTAACLAEELVARVERKPDAGELDRASAHWTLARQQSAIGDHASAAANFAVANDAWARSRESGMRSHVSGLVDEALALTELHRHAEARCVFEQAAALACSNRVPPQTAARAFVSLAQSLRRSGEADAARALAEMVLAAGTPIDALVRATAEGLVGSQ